jgi:hypothetical protein
MSQTKKETKERDASYSSCATPRKNTIHSNLETQFQHASQLAIETHRFDTSQAIPENHLKGASR